MKSIRILFASLFAMLCLVTSAFAGDVATEQPTQVIEIVGKSIHKDAPPVATTESFTLGAKGVTLWSIYVSEKRPMKDWPKYWEEASTLSGIPHTDSAWRKLPVGTKITAPRSPFAIIADKVEQEHAQNVALEQAERTAMQKDLADTRVLLEEVSGKVFKFALTTLLGSVLIIVLLYWLMYTKWKLSASTAECERLGKELQQERKDPDRFVFPTSDAPNVTNDVRGCGTCGDDATTEKTKCSGESCGGCPSCDGACSSKPQPGGTQPVDPR